MKQDMNKLIESFFARKENVLSESAIEDLVRNQFKLLREESYVDMAKTSINKGYGKSQKKELNIKYSFIPEISVSELGWSALNTKEGGQSPQRKQLDEYLKNISGNSLAEKFKAIQDFYDKPLEELEKQGLIESSSNSSKIQKIMSYLVFLKTLTTIITNFNAASAGFAFESFLGVLLNGVQVVANTGTIADLTTGDGIGISLKLYSEKGVHVGGSFTDLCNDMVNPKNPSKPFIRYIIAVKSLKGTALEMQGEITVYQFDINLQNLYNVMVVSSSESRECLRLPKLFIESNGQTDFSHYKKTQRTPEQIQQFFEEKMSVAFENEDPQKFQDWYEDLKEKHELNDFWTGKADKEGNKTLGFNEPNKKMLEKIFNEFANLNKLSQPSNVKQYIEIAKGVYSQTHEFAKGKIDIKTVQTEGSIKLRKLISEAKEVKSELIPGVQFASYQESLDFYNKSSDEIKKKCLKNTNGYINIMQFGMTKKQLLSVLGQTQQEQTGPVAKLTIGKDKVQEKINGLASAINQSVFQIFDNLSILTSNINTYFATGLNNDAAADMAQVAASNIDKKTGEIKKTAKS